MIHQGEISHRWWPSHSGDFRFEYESPMTCCTNVDRTILEISNLNQNLPRKIWHRCWPNHSGNLRLNQNSPHVKCHTNVNRVTQSPTSNITPMMTESLRRFPIESESPTWMLHRCWPSHSEDFRLEYDWFIFYSLPRFNCHTGDDRIIPKITTSIRLDRIWLFVTPMTNDSNSGNHRLVIWVATMR